MDNQLKEYLKGKLFAFPMGGQQGDGAQSMFWTISLKSLPCGCEVKTSRKTGFKILDCLLRFFTLEIPELKIETRYSIYGGEMYCARCGKYLGSKYELED